jgi:hypothetical protein
VAVFTVSSLQALKQLYGADSTVCQAATNLVASVVTKLANNIETVHQG